MLRQQKQLEYTVQMQYHYKYTACSMILHTINRQIWFYEESFIFLS